MPACLNTLFGKRGYPAHLDQKQSAPLKMPKKSTIPSATMAATAIFDEEAFAQLASTSDTATYVEVGGRYGGCIYGGGLVRFF